MPIEYESTEEQKAIAREVAAAMKPRRRLRSDGPMNELLRGQKANSDRKTEARVQPKVAKILGQHEPEEAAPDAPDIAALRAEAKEAREEAASARRRAEAARRRAGS